MSSSAMISSFLFYFLVVSGTVNTLKQPSTKINDYMNNIISVGQLAKKII